MMSGNFSTVSSRIDDALANGGDNLVGMGSTLEGFGVNMFMYEYILERAWDTGISDRDWINALADSSEVSVFEGLEQLERGIYHIGDVEYDIRIMCENIAIKDDVTYLVLSLKNMSAVSYAMSSPRFVIESKRKTKRGLVYEKQIFPKHCYGECVTAPETESRIVYSFDKVTLAKGQVFRIYFYEDGGPRNFVLNFGVKDINMTI